MQLGTKPSVPPKTGRESFPSSTRDVTSKDRRFFLDTVFRGFPSPSIFLHKVLDEGKTIYHVVDGKQRLETIFKFINNKLVIDKDFGDARLDNKRWKDISSDPDLAKLLWDYVLPVEFLNVEISSTFVNEVFDRLNRNSRKLVEQELRHAKYDGWFISFVERETEELDWKELGIVTTSRTKRMKDVQFLSELLIVVLKNDISGFDQEQIDEYYAAYDDLSDTVEEIDDEKVTETFVKTRRYLVDMEKANKCISLFANDFKNFYTLWTIVVLKFNSLPEPTVFSELYSSYMAEVSNLKDPEILDKYVQSELTPKYASTVKYYQSGMGASTEEPQRRARFEAISELVC